MIAHHHTTSESVEIPALKWVGKKGLSLDYGEQEAFDHKGRRWSGRQCARAEALAAWPKIGSEPTLPATSPQEVALDTVVALKQAKRSLGRRREWYIERHRNWPKDQKPPSRVDDVNQRATSSPK